MAATKNFLRTGFSATVPALVAGAALLFPTEVAAQQAQQTQAEVPENWAELAGICRRTLADCVGKSTTATRLNDGETVDVDGRIEESIWARAVWISDFVQREPIEGAQPTVRTEVAFAYDETNLYVAGRNYDPDPSSIRANLARRDDNGDSDRLKISLDSYQNRQTYYTFTITAAGGRVDYFGPSDQDFNRDHSYDPIWDAAAEITDEGWFAEMAIPFSQIRFTQGENIEFGLQVNRFRPAQFEDLFWTSVPKDENGWTSWFGDLKGLQGIQTRRPIEFVPYAASNLAVTSDELLNPDNPFSERSDLIARFGADIKMGVGSGLTFDATFNPDFGQVEADPAEVNLSAFPTFFDERRPFFVENAQLLEANDLFFSRRIGARPHGSPGGDFADVPDNTTIIGAAKLTGRTAGGLSLGALGAVTAEESAKTYDALNDTFGETRVEPTAGWLVLRGRQEFGAAKSTAGLAFTGVKRDLADSDPLASRINKEAYAFAADASLKFRGGLTELTGIIQGSHISGTPAAIARVQQFSAHYFQRPDAGHVEFDPTRTSLTGYRAYVDLRHTDGEHWSFETEVLATSPEFDINDAGALGRADQIDLGLDLQYNENTVGTFRSWGVAGEFDTRWNFDGDRLFTSYEARWQLGLINFWRFGGEFDYRPAGLSDTQTRGGPVMGTAGEKAFSINVNSPFQNRFGANGFLYYENDDLDGSFTRVRVNLQYRPGGSWRFALSPSYGHGINTRQYVTTESGGRPETFGNRYVFARIDQHTISAQFRVNYAFSADLSLEGYFEPFASTGAYSDYGELMTPRESDLLMYGTGGTTISESTGDAPHTITVQDGPDQFSFIREDFRALSFRSNLVMRWEWLPGSTLFVVWQLDRGGFGFENGPDSAGFGDLLDSPGEPGRNFFAVKATYWLPI
ncbi:MAG: carbohydrate binding family 9 domain-containing protein [Gemmatimonadota bacterium]|nr:carbohydrate binding family 9 domain-containing protein [Gemmatimonadota bacterium]